MITLKGLLSVIESTKPITINLFNKNNILLITFGHPGYNALEDTLEDAEITKIKFNNLNNIDITLDVE